MSSDAHKDPREKIVRLLGDDARKNPYRKYGPAPKASEGRMVHCGKEFHEARPMGELCPNCRDRWELEEEQRAKRAKQLEEEARKARTAPTQPALPKVSSYPFPPGYVTVPGPPPPSDGERLFRFGVRGGHLPPGYPTDWNNLTHAQRQIWENQAANILRSSGRRLFENLTQ